jgi:hypothetical protein
MARLTITGFEVRRATDLPAHDAAALRKDTVTAKLEEKK